MSGKAGGLAAVFEDAEAAIVVGGVPAAMRVLNQRRKNLEIAVLDLEEAAGISASSYYSWAATRRQASSARSATYLCLAAVANALGYEIVMRDSAGRDHLVPTPRSVMALVNAARRQRGWTFADCERESGVSASTLFALAAGKRDGRLPSVIAIVSAIGGELVLQAIEN